MIIDIEDSVEEGEGRKTSSVGNITEETGLRFRRLESEANDRINLDLTHERFLNMLMDVYEYHLEGGREND